MFKDQLTSDMENVFMNSNELADSVTIDGVVTAGFLLERTGNEGDLVYILKVVSTTIIAENSIVIVNGKTYGIVGEPYNDGFGSLTVMLGSVL